MRQTPPFLLTICNPLTDSTSANVNLFLHSISLPLIPSFSLSHTHSLTIPLSHTFFLPLSLSINKVQSINQSIDLSLSLSRRLLFLLNYSRFHCLTHDFFTITSIFTKPAIPLFHKLYISLMFFHDF